MRVKLFGLSTSAAVVLLVCSNFPNEMAGAEQTGKTIIGSSKAAVDALLAGWESHKSDFYSADTPTYDYQKDVTLTVTFANDKAVGVVATERSGSISDARFKELVALIGGPPPKPEDILRVGNGIHAFTMGGPQ